MSRKLLSLFILFLFSMVTDAMAQKPEDFPLISGTHRMTDHWSISLGETQFRRRVEDGSLVIWRPGITLWVDIWGYPKETSREDFINQTRTQGDLPPGSKRLSPSTKDGIDRFGYTFEETMDGGTRRSLQTFSFGPDDHVMMAIYFDKESDLKTAETLWKSVTRSGQ